MARGLRFKTLMESILDQTYNGMRIAVRDDGSVYLADTGVPLWSTMDDFDRFNLWIKDTKNIEVRSMLRASTDTSELLTALWPYLELSIRPAGLMLPYTKPS